MTHRTRYILTNLALILFFTFKAAQASTIQLPQTGQTLCYDPTNSITTPVVCSSTTGQDGNTLAGKPMPSPRFIDNGNGTVTDNLTGLIWLKDAGCVDTVGGITKGLTPATSYLFWPQALTWSNNLASGFCGLSDGSVAGDWRLPNITELESLIDHQNSNPALPSEHPFLNIQFSYPNYFYWSSTSVAQATVTNRAFNVSMSSGASAYWTKTTTNSTNFGFVLPVRDAQ